MRTPTRRPFLTHSTCIALLQCLKFIVRTLSTGWTQCWRVRVQVRLPPILKVAQPIFSIIPPRANGSKKDAVPRRFVCRPCVYRLPVPTCALNRGEGRDLFKHVASSAALFVHKVCALAGATGTFLRPFTFLCNHERITQGHRACHRRKLDMLCSPMHMASASHPLFRSRWISVGEC